MAKARNSYINTELEWADKQLETWKQYALANPMDKLRDRFDAKGKCVANREAQGKFLTELMKNYLALIEVVDRLREAESEKTVKVRGTEELTPLERGDIK